jgi:hypothetical protein
VNTPILLKIVMACASVASLAYAMKGLRAARALPSSLRRPFRFISFAGVGFVLGLSPYLFTPSPGLRIAGSVLSIVCALATLRWQRRLILLLNPSADHEARR